VWRYSDGVADCSRGACTRSGLAKLLRGKHSILDHAQRGHLADIERCRGFRQSDLANWGPFPRAGFLCRLDVRAECPDPGGDPGSLASPFKGSTTITDAQAKDLMDGRWYFNIHTRANLDGEIRGQIVRIY
jgi:hypothetical protein